ncbi:MAG: HD domain-containing protein [Anaerolineae bacterium]|nr:HD domain-containing protein [Anaerolineae bacterium]
MITVAQAQTYYHNDSAHDFDHVLRVLANAEHIGRIEQANMSVLRSATLLHDIARADQEETGQDHAAEGARRASLILREAGQPSEFIVAVCHAIETHRFRVDNPPQTLEAKILYDADKLDSIGAIGVARAFAYGGYVNRPLWAEDDSHIHTAWQEFRLKLSKVKDSLFTETARQMAQERHLFMVQFFEQIAREMRGEQ